MIDADFTFHCNDSEYPECCLPFARLQNGQLVIESKHRGKRHVSIIDLSEVLDKLKTHGIEVGVTVTKCFVKLSA